MTNPANAGSPGRYAEWSTIARHAGTVLVGQLAVMAFGVTDTLVAARHSSQALAALSVGAAVYATVFVALMGLIQAQLPLWSRLHGAGEHAALGRSARQALYLCGAAMAIGCGALLAPGPLLSATGVPASMQPEVRRYLAVLALALPAALLFRGFSTLSQSLGRPILVTWLQLGALALKVPLSIWFTFGGAGLAAQGLVGCAWATVIVMVLMSAVAAGLIRHAPLFRRWSIWARPEPVDWAMQGRFLRIGVPTALAITVEVTSFTLMALLIARMGVQASASHQIAGSVAAVLYMMPLSLGIAASARLSYWLGAGEPARARQALRLGLGSGFALAAASALALVLVREPLALLYAGGNAAVATAAAGLLAWVALYHLADALQGIGAFLLRSFGIALAPLIIYGVLLWGLGLGGGWWLAFHGQPTTSGLHGPAAFWSAAAVSLGLAAAAIMVLLRRAARSLQPGAAAPCASG